MRRIKRKQYTLDRRINFCIGSDVADRLILYADRKNISLGELLRRIVVEYLTKEDEDEKYHSTN